MHNSIVSLYIVVLKKVFEERDWQFKAETANRWVNINPGDMRSVVRDADTYEPMLQIIKKTIDKPFFVPSQILLAP